MLELPGIDPDKVRRHGKRFLKLIRSSQTQYEKMMQQNEDRPQDPNHHLVIDLSSDDDDDDIENGASADDEPPPQGERSQYFQSQSDVNAFNAQCETYLLLALGQSLTLV